MIPAVVSGIEPGTEWRAPRLPGMRLCATISRKPTGGDTGKYGAEQRARPAYKWRVARATARFADVALFLAFSSPVLRSPGER